MAASKTMSNVSVNLVSRYNTRKQGTPVIQFDVLVKSNHEFLGEICLKTTWMTYFDVANKTISGIKPCADFGVQADDCFKAVISVALKNAVKDLVYESLPVNTFGKKEVINEPAVTSEGLAALKAKIAANK